jgi:hypothetical protein
MSEFYFYAGDHRDGVRSVKITKSENQIITFFYPYANMGEFYAKTEMSNFIFNNFINDLSLIRIDRWKNKYDNPSLMDGVGWGISIKFYDKQEPIKKSGYSNFPEGYDEFTEMIKKYFPKMDRGLYRYRLEKDENTGDNIIMEYQKDSNSKYRYIPSRPFDD